MSSRFEQLSSETVHEGRFISLTRRTFRHEDGEEVQREIVSHPGAVAIIALDGDTLWLVRQPREAIGSPDLLELPAGKIDHEGQSPLETAQRELAEEIGKAAAEWEHLLTFHTSPGFTDEALHIFLATGLSDARADVDENERIDIVCHRLEDLDALLDATTDSKTLIGLYALRRRLRG